MALKLLSFDDFSLEKMIKQMVNEVNSNGFLRKIKVFVNIFM